MMSNQSRLDAEAPRAPPPRAARAGRGRLVARSTPAISGASGAPAACTSKPSGREQGEPAALWRALLRPARDEGVHGVEQGWLMVSGSAPSGSALPLQGADDDADTAISARTICRRCRGGLTSTVALRGGHTTPA
jgi:hypothetical protein